MPANNSKDPPVKFGLNLPKTSLPKKASFIKAFEPLNYQQKNKTLDSSIAPPDIPV
jgi:hypothetical protein